MFGARPAGITFSYYGAPPTVFPMRIRNAFLSLAVLGLIGCTSGSASNRYVSAGKRDYNNGTEIYVIDTTRGRACRTFLSQDPKIQSSAECIDFPF